MNPSNYPDPVDVAVDTGGTFTDLVFRHQSGRLRIAKVPSTPADPSRAVLDGIISRAKEWDVPLHSIQRVVHGTTVATNAIIEKQGARVGLVTTKGFRDVLEIGRQMRTDMYNLHIQPATPSYLAPRSRRVGVPERLDASGQVLTPLDESALVSAVESLVADGVDSIAICFLFAHLNPEHEQRARQLIAMRWPSLPVSISSEVDPSVREYERTVATAFDAYVKPIVSGYLQRLQQGLKVAGVHGPLQVIQSRGGLASAQAAGEQPVRLVLSGPAGGVIAGRELCSIVGIPNIITFDVGGTSSDIALVAHGNPVVRTEGTINAIPVRVPMVDVNAIGAGGGSIAWMDGAGGLRVGPHSAGSDPGPACYGRGGKLPTVTDASIVLGYVDPAYFAGGRLKLRPELSLEAIERVIAQPLGISAVEAALGIHRVVNAQMASGIKLVSIKQGYDARDFALVPMGGGGGVHATALADELEMTKVVVPPHPGVMAAAGLLSADIEHEAVRPVHARMEDLPLPHLKALFLQMDADCELKMVRDGAPPLRSVVEHIAEVCYVGQSFVLEVVLGNADDGVLERLAKDFNALHDRVYGQSSASPILIERIKSLHRFRPAGGQAVAPVKTEGQHTEARRRLVHFDGAGACETVVVHRSALRRESPLVGPAIVEQEDTTTIVGPGWTCELTSTGVMVLTRSRN